MSVLDDYMVSPDVSFIDKTRVQAQVPVLRALTLDIIAARTDSTCNRFFCLAHWRGRRAYFAELLRVSEPNLSRQPRVSDWAIRAAK